VVPSSGPLSENGAFRDRVLVPDERWRATLAYGQPFEAPGFHVMDAPTTHPTETITGLGGTGVQVLLGHAGSFPLQGHPMIPLIQVSGTSGSGGRFAADLDLQLAGEGAPEDVVRELERVIAATASREYVPRLAEAGATDFQMTRGRLSVSV
jgi:altronate dehydratase